MQPPVVFYKKGSSKKLLTVHGKTSVPGSNF